MVPEKFIRSLGDVAYSLDEPMCTHTTFKIGGNADIMINVPNAIALCGVISSAKALGVPYFVLGKGSNLLVSDSGIEGAVICLSALSDIRVSGRRITCGAGANLAAVCTAARDAGLTGLEFAYGIPGSVGGALYMNAGAYGGEMSQITVSAECVDGDGNIITVSKDDMALGYRMSAFKQKGLIITAVTFELKHGDINTITADMRELLQRRKDKQPLEYPSAGSTFKRPVGNFAGALIEKNNLKGMSVGAAQVSVKHAGFVINTGGATCKDVMTLIKKIQQVVLENDGVQLETEIIFVGRKEEKR